MRRNLNEKIVWQDFEKIFMFGVAQMTIGYQIFQAEEADGAEMIAKAWEFKVWHLIISFVHMVIGLVICYVDLFK
jgi:hypothetical protein